MIKIAQKTKVEIEFDAVTKEFNSNIKASEKHMTSLRKELKLNATELKGDAENVELLSKRKKLLAEQSIESKNKIENLNNKLNEAKRLFGEDAEQVRLLGNQITDAKTQFAAIQNEIKDTDKKLDSFANIADKTDDEIKGLSDATEKSGGIAEKAGKGFTVFKGVLANLISQGVSKLKDELKELITTTDKASSHVQAAVGATDEAAGKFRNVIKNVYNNNFGESMEDIADAVIKINENFGDNYGEEQLQKITEKAITLRDVFDMDISETLRGVNGLVTNMGLDIDEAFDYMVVGAQQGLNKTGELGDNIAEYSQLWGQAGFSAQGMFTILDNGLSAGAYNLDQVNDFVKEFNISLADGRMGENIKSFSKESQELFKNWKNGKATGSEVFQSIINDLGNMENKQKALTIASETWSSLGEDNAMSVLTSLTEVNHMYDDVKGSAEKLADVQYDNVGDAIEGLGRNLKSAFQGPLEEKVLPELNEKLSEVDDKIGGLSEKIGLGIDGLMTAYDWTTKHKALLIGIGGVIGTVAVGIGIYNAAMALGTALKTADAVSIGGLVAAKWAENTANWALAASGMAALGPILLIAAGIAALIAVIVLIVKNFDTLKAKVKDVTESTSEKFNAWKEKTVSSIKAIPESIGNFFEGIKNKIKVPKIEVTYTNEGTLAKVAQALGLEGFPKLSIRWNKYGYFKQKTIVAEGYAEAGDSEYALPLNSRTLDPLAAGVVNHMDINNDEVIEYVKALYSKMLELPSDFESGFIDAVANRLKINLDKRELGRVVRSY